MTQSDVIYVRRGNVLLEANEETVEKYLADGFDQVDNRGRVIKAGAPNDTAALKRRFEEQKKEIKELQEEIKSLEEALKKASTSTKKTAGSKA